MTIIAYLRVNWHCAPRRSKMRGVTLIEIMFTLAIIGVAASLSAPMFTTTIARSRITGYANELLAAFSLARSEAVMRGRRVVICKSSDGTTCATSGDWEQGWMTFVDMDNDAVADPGELPPLRVHDPLDSSIMVKGGSAATSSYISYWSDGRARLINGDAQTGTIAICSKNNLKLWSAIDLNFVGRAKTDKDCSLNRQGSTNQSACSAYGICP